MNNENNENNEIEETLLTEFYYEVSWSYPFSVKRKVLQEWSVIGEGLRTFHYAIQAYVFQYQVKVIHFSKKLTDIKKEDRPYLRKKIKDLVVKIDKKIQKNAEYFIWEM